MTSALDKQHVTDSESVKLLLERSPRTGGGGKEGRMHVSKLLKKIN